MNNDRFKLRVWDTKEKKMYSDGWLVGVARNGYVNNQEDIVEWYILMACTGLRDSEGTLIFEGDVLGDPSPFVKIEYNPHYLAPMCFRIDGLGGSFLINTILEKNLSLKVIGNIYQHSELLDRAGKGR